MVRLARFIHQHPDWPRFVWDSDRLLAPLAQARKKQGILLGKMLGLGAADQARTTLATLTTDAVESGAIEGEHFDPAEVRSSVARRLGIAEDVSRPPSRRVDGFVSVLLDALHSRAEPMNARRLCAWHAALFPEGHIGFDFKAAIGRWREAPVQVVSGNIGDPVVHFEGVEAGRIGDEIAAFLSWLETTPPADAVIRSAVAHLWFATIHPFEDGNGRIARILADRILAQEDATPHRFYSLSRQLKREQKAYYAQLEHAQRGTLDITAWLCWYVGCFYRALDESEAVLDAAMRKSRFFQQHGADLFNKRQNKVLLLALEGAGGKLTVKRWREIAGCSVVTATRDVNELVGRGILSVAGAGRSTHYLLNVG